MKRRAFSRVGTFAWCVCWFDLEVVLGGCFCVFSSIKVFT